MIGRDNWPNAEDEQRLPYIRAIIKEVRHETLAMSSLLSYRSSVPSGVACPLAILVGSAALFYRRLGVQRDVHTEGYGGPSELL